MSQVISTYEGELVVKCVQATTQASILAESKIKDFGHEDSFTPLDLLSAALGSCMLNTMGYFANRHSLDITGAEADVTRTWSSDGRSIESFEVTLRMPPHPFTDAEKKAFETAIQSCPAHKALASVKQNINFIWL